MESAVELNAGPRVGPAGWYQNPAGPGHKYWNGATWIDRHNRAVASPAAVQIEPSTPAIVVAGYFCAVLMPVLGCILGIAALSRPQKATSRHGLWIVGASAIGLVVWLAIIQAAWVAVTYN